MRRRVIIGTVIAVGIAFAMASPAFAACDDAAKCSGVLPDSWCEGAGAGVINLLGLILNILTAGVGVAMTIGLVIAGIQWLSSRDNDEQAKKSKRRIVSVIIGGALWALMWGIVNWLIPGFSTDIRLPAITGSAEECEDAEGEEYGVGGDGGDEESTHSPFPVGNPIATSVDIPCQFEDTGEVVDLGIHSAWNDGRRVEHRLCAVTNIEQRKEGKNVGNTMGTEDIVKAIGRPELADTVVVNSRVSGAYYAMAKAAAKDGVRLVARSSFRTMKKQLGKGTECFSQKDQNWLLNMDEKWKSEDKKLRKIAAKCPNKAAPGYSPHQDAVAVDWSKRTDDEKIRCTSSKTECGKKDELYDWLVKNSTKFGIAQLRSEYWHYDTKCPPAYYKNGKVVTSKKKQRGAWGDRYPVFCGGTYNGADAKMPD